MFMLPNILSNCFFGGSGVTYLALIAYEFVSRVSDKREA